MDKRGIANPKNQGGFRSHLRQNNVAPGNEVHQRRRELERDSGKKPGVSKQATRAIANSSELLVSCVPICKEEKTAVLNQKKFTVGYLNVNGLSRAMKKFYMDIRDLIK